MSFQGTAPLVNPSELTYFNGMANGDYSFTVSGGLFVTTNGIGGSTYLSMFSVNSSGPETDNVYVGMDVGLVSGNATSIFVGFVLDATHYLTASPGSFGTPGFLNKVVFAVRNGVPAESRYTLDVSPLVPYDTSATFLTQYLSISGTLASVYAINQSTGLLALLATQDVSAVVSAATLQTWSAGSYFTGSGSTSVSVRNWHWGPNSDLAHKTVPNVVGETQAQATTDIIAAGLVVGTVGTSSSSPPGFVVSQTPAPGTLANFGDLVNIVVSTGLLQKVYGKFVGSPVFPPTLLINAKGIKPRVYVPKENVTVKT